MYLLTRAAPIHVASRKGYKAIIDLLLTYGANVNAVTSDGKTCLHIVASKCVSSSGEKSFLDCLSRILNAKGVQVNKSFLFFNCFGVFYYFLITEIFEFFNQNIPFKG